MSASTSKPYDWLKTIPRSLLEFDTIPLFGATQPFPWEEVAGHIASELGLDGLELTVSDAKWREKEDLFSSLGDNLIPLNLSVSGLEGSLCWVMDRDELYFFASKLLNTEGEELDEETSEGFYRFLGYTAVNAISKADWDKTVSLHILNKKEMPAESSFCMDIKAIAGDHTLTGRLIISPTFQRAWKERFADRSLSMPGLGTTAGQQAEVTVHLEAGRTAFTSEEWEKLKAGDFILLDSCSLKEGGKGKVTLTLMGTPLYTGRIKRDSIKIEEHPDFREVDVTMPDDPHKNDDTDFEDEFEDESFTDDDYDENLDSSDESDLEDESDFQDDDESSSFDDQEFDSSAQVEEEEQQVQEEPAPKSTKASLEKTQPVSPSEIPMSVVVEVGRIKMNVKKLMELQPGNVIDLDVNPEDGIDLTVNGRCVAKAELLRVGETLGVRILDIG